MKKLFNLFLFLCMVITVSAQHRAFMWDHDRSVTVSSSTPDSITFALPKINISLSTGDPTEVTENSMTAYYVIKSDFSFVGKDVEAGVCYSSIDEQPTIDNNTIVHASEVKSQTWSQVIDNLDKGRTYYYRSFAKIGDDIVYGQVKKITTGSVDDKPATPSYVDLGLSVKWATCNLGATNPEDYGNYYAWGETLPKDSYSWDNYKFGDTLSSISKYNKSDGKNTLDADDDAATVNLGRPWRLPTLSEANELMNNCTWEWTSVNGINGNRIIGPNGNTIFLPAAGFKYEKGNSYVNSVGYYWCSLLSDEKKGCLYGFELGGTCNGNSGRCSGLPVRPVHP